jgi:hypothetical protein
VNVKFSQKKENNSVYYLYKNFVGGGGLLNLQKWKWARSSIKKPGICRGVFVRQIKKTSSGENN